MKVRLGKITSEFLPEIARRYFSYSLLILLELCLVLDTGVIPFLEDSGAIACYAWKEEAARIRGFTFQRNQADAKCPVWRSYAYPISKNPRKGHRILVMGDSFVWGHGYANM